MAMNALILGLVLSQATATVRISVSVVRPTCVVVDGSGAAKVVSRRAITRGERPTGCTLDPGAGTPRIAQVVEAAGTKDAPEQRLILIDY
jgi:hypothetical protein